MSQDRAKLILWLREEIMGPTHPWGNKDRNWSEATVEHGSIRNWPEPVETVTYQGQSIQYYGNMFYRNGNETPWQEILYYSREAPKKKYGVGLLHPERIIAEQDQDLPHTTDPQDPAGEAGGKDDNKNQEKNSESQERVDAAQDNDFEVSGQDRFKPSTIGISFLAEIPQGGELVFKFPQHKRFAWQEADPDAKDILLNGYYVPSTWHQSQHGKQGSKPQTSEQETENKLSNQGEPTANQDNTQSQNKLPVQAEEQDHNKHNPERGKKPCWIRYPVFQEETAITVTYDELQNRRAIRRDLVVKEGCPLRLRFELFPRQDVQHGEKNNNQWLITAVLRNISPADDACILYQAFWEVETKISAKFKPYPEVETDAALQDEDSQSLMLLYRDSRTWGIGHGCSAGWESEPGQTPSTLFADVLPAVETPSMTPDVEDVEGNRIAIAMNNLAKPDWRPVNGDAVWDSLCGIAEMYTGWIDKQEQVIKQLDQKYQNTAQRHLDACRICRNRIKSGLDYLRVNENALCAFKMANLAMLFQQIATKNLKPRPLVPNPQGNNPAFVPDGNFKSPIEVYYDGIPEGFGKWRAFQVAFLLMSINEACDHSAKYRDCVDLIWFPTGGGKTEAYLAVASFTMFFERLLINDDTTKTLGRDGTNILMRYTLRMLTTQQFQRASALICSMEIIRQGQTSRQFQEKYPEMVYKSIPGREFSLGLWLGNDGTPNKIDGPDGAIERINQFKDQSDRGNPLVLTECPWCRSAIGKEKHRLYGIIPHANGGPRLQCTDHNCPFCRKGITYIPVQVIDEILYKEPPSFLIGTVDKFAMLAYHPKARVFLGRNPDTRIGQNDEKFQINMPPTLIIQDELHLISGPLGTIYGLYEGIIESLCTSPEGTKPRIICSTATIRGAAEQVKALYARNQISLFPSPGLSMEDSFFGRYARDPQKNNKLQHGRIYVGLHAPDYSSILTAQVRIFSSILHTCHSRIDTAEEQDPWRTLLVFYNSLRELGGGRTLFDSDIGERLKHIHKRNRDGNQYKRDLKQIEELSSRLDQSELVGKMATLGLPHRKSHNAIDVCLSSNIIEVGVDIDRLSLMGIVGQPKNTAQYIQVTGRVGRRWWERPGLILMVYSVSKARDRSHYEQFHSYHRRLYEQVEPTTATPFSTAAIERAAAGAILTGIRQAYQDTKDPDQTVYYQHAIENVYNILYNRCEKVENDVERERSIQKLVYIKDRLWDKWLQHPQIWENYNLQSGDHPLMLWPGKYATDLQKRQAEIVLNNMRQVDASAEIQITER